jgi:hypothetical protein
MCMRGRKCGNDSNYTTAIRCIKWEGGVKCGTMMRHFNHTLVDTTEAHDRQVNEAVTAASRQKVILKRGKVHTKIPW